MECPTPEELVTEFRKRLIEWGRANYEEWPWRKDRTPYKVLIAELLLKRTTRQAVGREYNKFIEKFPDIESIYRASFEEVRDAFRPLGLYNQRAKQLKEVARAVVEQYGGEIPDDIDRLKSLPGVADYIAGAVMSFGFGKPAIIPDANVIRVLARVTGIERWSSRGKLKLYAVLEKLLPEDGHEDFNYALLDLGGTVCRYDRPRCFKCPLRDLCVMGHNDEEMKQCLRRLYKKLGKRDSVHTKVKEQNKR
ncbi:A/G-specific adenine glycosylase [Thermococcus sp. 18S1]|uniref:A/G-specific adenine glycosylase n=1 Tax=Thermococcus sp. 18S1 TaxID=1638210 RepID=UPI001439A0E2|nr:A/G-specific adenine glycosylase [Thermococcus sp. 18S1]